jgi:hypothetical protein
MIIRDGLHTIYEGLIFRFYEKNSKYHLIFNGTKPPDHSFVKEFENIYVKSIEKSLLKNSFYIKSKCIYKGFEFNIENNNGKSIRILTENNLAYEKLNLEIRDRGMYQTVVKLNELEKLWEVRTDSHLHKNIPSYLVFEHLDLTYKIEQEKIELNKTLK